MEIVEKICDKLGIISKHIIFKKYNLNYADIIGAYINSDSTNEASEILGLTKSSLECFMARNMKTIVPTDIKGTNWNNRFLSVVSLKRCHRCKSIRDEILFGLNTKRKHGCWCRSCNNIYNKTFMYKRYYSTNIFKFTAKAAKRRADKLKATPIWADLNIILDFYRNKPKGYHVDHYYPLNSDIVCGLHVIENLQYLTEKDNLIKGNKMPLN